MQEEPIIDNVSVVRRKNWRLFVDAVNHSPWEFGDSLFFSLASLFFILDATFRFLDEINTDLMNILGVSGDFLSAFCAVISFQLAWKKYYKKKKISYIRFLKDFSFYDGTFFMVSALTEVYDIYADHVQFKDGSRTDAHIYWTDVVINVSLMIASLSAMTETIIFWRSQQVDIKFTHISTVMNNEVYAIAPCLSKDENIKNYKIYWLFWSDLFYIFGAFFYLFCDFNIFFTDDTDVQDFIDNLGQLLAGISFIINCTLYTIVFIQAEEDLDDEIIAKTMMDPNHSKCEV